MATTGRKNVMFRQTFTKSVVQYHDTEEEIFFPSVYWDIE